MTPPQEVCVGFVTDGSVQRAMELEALGVDSLWAGGHVASRSPSPEAMVSLARLSAVTERVRLGTALLVLPLYSPAIIAKQVADLDNATGGRLSLGVGVGGEYPAEWRACQVSITERGRRLDEAMPLLRALWTAGEISHGGPFYPMQDVRVHPAPAQPGGPPLIVGGRSEAAMRRAALLGDGWMPYLYSPQRYAASVDTIRSFAAEAGRDLRGFEYCAFVFVNIDDDGDRARADAARTIPGGHQSDALLKVRKVAAAGTAGEVTSILHDFVAAGVRHFVFAPATGGSDPAPVVRRMLEEVMPAVRQSSLS